jgi:hypothetical protein
VQFSTSGFLYFPLLAEALLLPLDSTLASFRGLVVSVVPNVSGDFRNLVLRTVIL